MHEIPKIIVIGTGSMGQNHVRLLSHSQQSILVGFVELEERPRQLYSKAYRIPGLATLDEALASLEFDAAIVATPTETHFHIAKKLLDAGKHVLVEKPITPNVAEGFQLLELSLKKKLILLGGHVERFNPAVIQLQEKIQDLGHIYHIETERTGPFPERIFLYGVATDLLVHDIDLILMLTKMTPTWTFAHQEKRVHPTCEDGITVLLGFPENICAVLKANWLSPTKERRFRIYGSKGMFEVDFLNRKLRFFENGSPKPVEDPFGLVGMEEGNEIKFRTIPAEPLAAELNYFISCIVKNQMDEQMTHTNIEAIGIVNKILESASRNEKLVF